MRSFMKSFTRVLTALVLILSFTFVSASAAAPAADMLSGSSISAQTDTGSKADANVRVSVVKKKVGPDGTEPALVKDGNDWMSNVKDSTPISKIRIPGTHDSATQYVDLSYFSQCQNKSIYDQLRCGYRYLDIRLGVDRTMKNYRLSFHHGFTNCRTSKCLSDKLYLEDVLSGCYTFLKAHPSETIVFAVKQEYGDDSVTEFEQLLNNTIQKNPKYWLLTDSIPTLGEARGKLVLMRRYKDEAGLGKRSGIPLLWTDQGGNDDTSLNWAIEQSGNYKLAVQDRFEYDTAEKWDAFKSEPNGKYDLAIDFLSTKGTGAVGHPKKYADKLNKKLAAYSVSKLPLAWYIVDFGSADASQIFTSNY